MPTPLAVIKKYGRQLEISADGENPLPASVMDMLANHLIFHNLQMLYGRDRYRDYMGHRHSVDINRERMFNYDGQNRFICWSGSLVAVEQLLRQSGRQVVILDRNPPLDQRDRPNCYEENWDAVQSQFTFRAKQDLCLALISAHDGGIIDATTAFGKRWIIAMTCVLYPHAKIDIVTKSAENVRDTYRMLLRYIPGVGRVGGGHRERGLKTVYTADSWHHSSFDADIVLVDECHQLVRPRHLRMLNRYQQARLFGFTASRNTRADNAWRWLESIYGPVVFFMDNSEAEQLGLSAQVLVQWIEINSELMGGVNPILSLDDPVEIKRMAFWRNRPRNRRIAEVVRTLVREGQQVLVLVDTVDHGLHLRRELPEATLCYAEHALQQPHKRLAYIQSGLMTSDEPSMTADRREAYRLAFEGGEMRCAIATSIWHTGVSFDTLNALVRAEGAVSQTRNIQLPGRVCRIDQATGKHVGLLLDCFDSFDPRLARRSHSRRLAYAKRKWIQHMEDGSVWYPRRRG